MVYGYDSDFPGFLRTAVCFIFLPRARAKSCFGLQFRRVYGDVNA